MTAQVRARGDLGQDDSAHQNVQAQCYTIGGWRGEKRYKTNLQKQDFKIKNQEEAGGNGIPGPLNPIKFRLSLETQKSQVPLAFLSELIQQGVEPLFQNCQNSGFTPELTNP